MSMNRPSATPGVGERNVSLPESITTPATYLVAGPVDPAEHALCLHALAQYSSPEDAALVVSTTESAQTTIDRFRSIPSRDARPTIGLIDAVSRRQYIPALYEDVPTVYTPSPRDLERLVLAMSELTETIVPAGARHLVIQSLTPSFSKTNVDNVCNFLDRVTGLRSSDGLGLVGLTLASHEDHVVAQLLQRVDGVLWVTERSNGSLDVTVRSPRNLSNL